jgi:RNA polymerase-binding transcription factor DksA
MPDHMDAIQELVLRQQEDAVARIERERARATGLAECERCDAPISALRQGLGARLCLDCQSDYERRQRGMPRVAI